ncbi:hypothetical protein ACQR16_10190 [Bradyrhizobium oligotrophicum]|uniref:hypothetical protein n=1 Tax=Bradyrhizobium oligotrophicum TaxID=44255 RepID=UPI003EBDB1CD
MPSNYVEMPGSHRESPGNNKIGGIGYDAGPRWNACTGLGVPDGTKLLAVFQQAAGVSVSAAAA